MAKTTIASSVNKEVTFIGKLGTYRFPFSPDIGDINKNPQKYEEYRVKRDDEIATQPDPVEVKETPQVQQPVAQQLEEITLNGKTYRKITGNEETIELNGVKYRAI
jgi:hypothetical protein